MFWLNLGTLGSDVNRNNMTHDGDLGERHKVVTRNPITANRSRKRVIWAQMCPIKEAFPGGCWSLRRNSLPHQGVCSKNTPAVSYAL